MGDLAKVVAAGAGALFLWRSLDEGTKNGVTRFVNGLLVEVERNQREKEFQQKLIESEPLGIEPPQVEPVAPLQANSPILSKQTLKVDLPDLRFETDSRWRELIPHPSVILILGKRGSGKSSLGYRLIELARASTKPYVVGLPESAASKLPGWIGIAASLDEVPPGSTVLIDEAYIHFHARNSQTSANKDLSQLLNLSRQNDQTLIFVTQESRQVDKNLVSVANVIVFKEPSALQTEFERPEVRKIAEKAVEEFRGVTGDRREWSYVFSPESDHVGLVQNQLATF